LFSINSRHGEKVRSVLSGSRPLSLSHSVRPAHVPASLSTVLLELNVESLHAADLVLALQVPDRVCFLPCAPHSPQKRGSNAAEQDRCRDDRFIFDQETASGKPSDADRLPPLTAILGKTRTSCGGRGQAPLGRIDIYPFNDGLISFKVLKQGLSESRP